MLIELKRKLLKKYEESNTMNEMAKNSTDISPSDKMEEIKEIKAKATIMLLQAQEYL